MCPFSHGLIIFLGISSCILFQNVPGLSGSLSDHLLWKLNQSSSSQRTIIQEKNQTTNHSLNFKELGSSHTALIHLQQNESVKFSKSYPVLHHKPSERRAPSADHLRKIPSRDKRNSVSNSHLQQIEIVMNLSTGFTSAGEISQTADQTQQERGSSKHGALRPVGFRIRKQDLIHPFNNIADHSIHFRSKRSLKIEKQQKLPNVKKKKLVLANSTQPSQDSLKSRIISGKGEQRTHKHNKILIKPKARKLGGREKSTKQPIADHLIHHGNEGTKGLSVATQRPKLFTELNSREFNLTHYLTFLQKFELQRQWNQRAQWAYFSVVLLLCLMLWLMWYLGGLRRCRYHPDKSVSFTDDQHLLTVPEVIRKKRKYLPMFSEPEWEEVLYYDRGSDP